MKTNFHNRKQVHNGYMYTTVLDQWRNEKTKPPPSVDNQSLQIMNKNQDGINFQAEAT